MSKAKAKGSDSDSEDNDELALSKPSKMPMMLALVNLLATGGVGFLVFSSAGAGAEAADPVDPDVPPIVIPLEPFVVNLNEPTSSRYLKATLEIEVHGEKRQETFEIKKRAIRSDVLRYLSGLAIDKTVGEENKVTIRDELTARVEAIMGEDSLAGLYLTEFVVQ